ncbi:MAG: hypothetical protein LBT40_10390 [Deltaproteobacteria bacterium]|nr:hypothetical protein [Deltaproteobacteria bacterium]
MAGAGEDGGPGGGVQEGRGSERAEVLEAESRNGGGLRGWRDLEAESRTSVDTLGLLG